MVREKNIDTAAKRPEKDQLGGDIQGTRSGQVHVSIGFLSFLIQVLERSILGRCRYGCLGVYFFGELISLFLQRGYTLERIRIYDMFLRESL
jgi:hypothetical protein